MSSKRGMTKREIIREISSNTELKSDLVESVLDNFADIFEREVIVNEKFHFGNLFSVESKKRSKRKGKDLKTGEIVEYPETRILSIKLSRRINYYFRNKVRMERNLKLGATPENWREKYAESKETEE